VISFWTDAPVITPVIARLDAENLPYNANMTMLALLAALPVVASKISLSASVPYESDERAARRHRLNLHRLRLGGDHRCCQCRCSRQKKKPTHFHLLSSPDPV
jgi:hypothetical protein